MCRHDGAGMRLSTLRASERCHLGIVTLSLISVSGLIINCLKLFEKNSEVKVLNKLFQVSPLNKSHWLLSLAWGVGEQDRGSP